MNFLIVLGIGVVLVVVSYLLATTDPIVIPTLEKEPTATTLRWVGTGLIATYILAVVAFVGIIASEVIRAFK